MPSRSKGYFEDLHEFINDELGYGNQWDAQIDQLAMHESTKRASDIARLNEYNKKNPEKHKEAVKKAMASRKERARSLYDLAEKMYGGLPCRSCGKRLTVTDLYKGSCEKCKTKTKDPNNDD